jgi:hypothetical protein
LSLLACDPCIAQPAKAMKYQMVRFDNNRFSASRTAAFQAVTVKVHTTMLVARPSHG